MRNEAVEIEEGGNGGGRPIWRGQALRATDFSPIFRCRWRALWSATRWWQRLQSSQWSTTSRGRPSMRL